MTQIIIGVVLFVVSIGVMVACSKTLPPAPRLVVVVVMVELVCVSGVLIAMGLDSMGLMD